MGVSLVDSQRGRSHDTLVIRGKEESPEPFRSGAQVFDFLAGSLGDLSKAVADMFLSNVDQLLISLCPRLEKHGKANEKESLVMS